MYIVQVVLVTPIDSAAPNRVAAEWLEANAEPLGGGLWRVSVEAVNELPDTLALVGLQEPVDGMLTITFGTPENPR